LNFIEQLSSSRHILIRNRFAVSFVLITYIIIGIIVDMGVGRGGQEDVATP